MNLPSLARPHGRRSTRTLLLVAVLASCFATVQAAGSTPAGAAPTPEVAVPGVVYVLDAASVPGDAIYLARGTTIERFVPGTPLQTITLPAGLDARRLAVAPDGTVWFGGLTGTIGTVAPDGAVTTRALAGSVTAIGDLVVGTDGAVWTISGSGYGTRIQRGAPGGPMTDIPLPEAVTPSYIGAGSDGSLLAVGANDWVIAADGTITALGLPAGFERDVTTIDGAPWVIGSSWAARIGAGNAVTTVDLTMPTNNLINSATEGPDGSGWAVTGGGTNDSHLIRFDATGPRGSTVAADTGPGESIFGASFVVADPTADRLWLVGSRSTESRLVPVDLDRSLSSVTVDDPGPLTFGLTTSLHAQITNWDEGPAPTGTVTFSSYGVALATVPVAADGSASATILPPYQSLNLRASYSGDATHGPSRSALVHRSVATPPSTITVTPPPQPWRPGKATFEVSVTSSSGAKPSGTVVIGDAAVAVSGGTTYQVPVSLALGANAVGATFMPAEGYAPASTTLPSAVARWETDEEDYVGAAYLRLFGRYPDPAGRTYWADKLRAGMSRDRFAVTQVATSEYRRTLARRVGLVAPGATVAQAKPMVDAMAKTTVRELLIQQWAAGKKVTTCRDTIAPQFAPAGSFMCWVKTIFYAFTGSASSDDFAWASKYGNTPEGREKVARILVYSDEAVRPIVAAAYSNYLNRTPDPSGWTYWTKKIQGGLREERVEAMVLGSNEFWRRTLLPATS
ncbi:MAG TPA: DUF4214 domain-containing protein [Acidimicrobiales bacterium]|nr:DUF4214 domain-containing protein [Acidimicrobiales bacterium]